MYSILKGMNSGGKDAVHKFNFGKSIFPTITA